MPKKERKLGIDLLRIVSMLMIVTLHVLKQGGILDNATFGTTQYYIAWVLEAACMGAVNCYALISGYVGVNSKIKYHKIAVLWLEVVFYSLICAAIFANTIPQEQAFETWADQFFPVYTRAYWYFTAYFVMFFFTPYFNVMLNSLSKKQLKGLGWCIFVFFSLLQTVWQSDVLVTKFGYSFIWLSLLYILGGIVKKTGLEKSVNAGLMLFCFVAFSLIGAGYKFLATQNGWAVVKDNLITYISATVFAASFCLFLFFARIDVRTKAGKAFVRLLSPYTFGVYLIHTNGFVWKYVLKDLFRDYLDMRGIKMLAMVAISVLGIYLICTCLEAIRSLLFKLLHIEPALAAIENKIRTKNSKKLN